MENKGNEHKTLDNLKIEPFWVEILQENIKAEMIYPPILSLKLNRAELALENGAYDIVKEYSNNFIEFFMEKKKSIRRNISY